MIARVNRLSGPPETWKDWNAPPWDGLPAESVRFHMGDRPEHFPKTQVKIAYDDAAVYAMFRVEDRYVRASAQKHQDSVCCDSCVEFFFSPGPDVSDSYFNLEMNCGGTLLFHFHPGAGKHRIEIPETECETICKHHSMPRIVDPEIREPVTWNVACEIPFALLRRYAPIAPPEPQARWRANFYKCADATSHPHWLTWAPVEYPRPNFHLPQFFGVLEFC